VAASSTSAVAAPIEFVARVWADNWYALWINGQQVAEDSEPLTQVRSFNADTITFTATYPLTIAMETKDYTEGPSGLEYIGTSRQQMGDGGFIAEFHETASGRLVAVTDGAWRGDAIDRAPLDASCVASTAPDTTCTSEHHAEPDGWTDEGFDASTWQPATIYTAAQVGPKGGYDTIDWDPSARLIWSSDLLVDNTVLWRAAAAGPV
jgi:hypothetical protein